MAVLVTGGAGYIGSHMVLELLDAGETPVVLDDLSTGFAEAVPNAVALHVGDFGDQPLVERIIDEHGVDAIVHFAAKIVVPESLADPISYYENNTCGALKLVSSAVRKRVPHFIFSSTAAVYGDVQTGLAQEDMPLKPVSPYGRSKLMVEHILEDVSRAHDLSHVALRYFNVAGADPQGRAGQSTKNATHLIKVAAQSALGVRPGMEVYGVDYPTPDGSCLRDYIQVTDLVRAHMDALRYLRTGGKSLVCNCGYGEGYSVLEVIRVVKEVSGVDFPVTFSDRRPGDSIAVIADNQKIKSNLGWRPIHNDLHQIVDQALNWERRIHNMEDRTQRRSHIR